MEIKLFGKSLFSAKKAKVDQLMGQATKSSLESKYLPDFYIKIGNDSPISNYVLWESNGTKAVSPVSKKIKGEKKLKKSKTITPKGAYDLQMLHDKTFQINTNLDYVDKQLVDFKQKLEMLNSEEYDMRNGVNEISSVITRLENRKKYAEVKDIFEEYPYTKTSKVAELVKILRFVD